MRIRVRDLSINDINIINKWHNDKSLFEFLVGNFYGPSLDETKKWIEKYQNEEKTFRGIISNENGKDIGIIYLINDTNLNEAELGIFIANKEYRHRGYGKEMFQWMLNFGFNVLKLNKIFLYALKDNNMAISLYKKYNFLENPTLSTKIVKNGKQADVVYMYLVKEKYHEENC